MTKLNEFDEFRLFLCARCYVTSLSMVSYINDFLRNCNTRKICYENRGFQVSFEDPFGFFPSYLESGINSMSIIAFYSNFPEARPYLEAEARWKAMREIPCPSHAASLIFREMQISG